MIYAQIKSGRKLHLAAEPGEHDQNGRIVLAGNLSYPICGQPMKEASSYRMTINVPLANACKKCSATYQRWSAHSANDQT